MRICTFFGHRDCPDAIQSKLRAMIVELITDYGVEMFYVGNQGRFDIIVRGVLRELKEEYPRIRYAVVLAYMPGGRTGDDDFEDTMLPAGIECVHPHYAISWRNNWMLRQADYIVAYVTHSWGGAARYAAKAERAGKRVFNVSDG